MTTKTYSTFGFALCCGHAPEVGLPHGHFEASCKVCGRRKGVYGGWLFLRRLWNAQFNGPRPETNNREQLRAVVSPELSGLPEGWRSAQLDVDLARFGHTDALAHDLDCVFWTPGDMERLLIADGTYECGIGDDRYLHPLKIAVASLDHVFECDWAPRKRYPYSHAYASRWYSTDGTWWLALHICATRTRDHVALQDWMDQVKPDSINGVLEEVK